MKEFNTRQIVEKYNFRFSKRLGQNFLTDNTVLDDIVENAEIQKDDFIIEIGPGVGTLTRRLLEKAKKVCAIELDESLIPIITNEMKEYDNFTLIHNDALKVDFNNIIGEEQSVKLVANLPYYVTTPIISKLLNEGYNFKSLTIMIQKEVGDRIAAKPSTKDYGALTLLVQYYCDVKVVRVVKPSCFIPQPKVDSLVIRLDKLEKPRVQVKDEKLFFNVIRSAFNMRRKTLWNAMKGLKLSSEDLEKAFEAAGIDSKRRGETLSIEEFGKLSDEIYR
ncbi:MULTISPECIES: 16S rRNA (adenine(1518)-N(6)/adenine(1519)-N(6))-dimethyltransferase RsmA [Clostridium]|uniref:Ribosomal RNA small subunit methyltransferase A n=1 Tax=Clostridium acetobutylicum (strain ATCC 824 / DSM 792 / JCM 1419 / IAM 19013 / LMG 5710 / NBRC 13948 / NRRL B-527 / VKM B-1787 / 2291 / W) TaxID=272562 RepID=RSMA_CLOAB|nr:MULTISPECIES: 16S rRNA (adenine(1518)-N(6)/adenine(1519)-N(6))-dimethyltransferase RsmA [Clostridium]Q97EX0.1 RecName: Full=Ribosomal RNA small subunit methyltransferase A; AltName: Full=16S rRNA (adenine(1518)-N(6)/adenine(1519)-N(6))-dimethyltransferase; AltName: Full=16S rRNA dimethyladenosine transferase; AltName: Full=16S rRNA dimethylase; AltName: Full=S-adenosylmethionine-6-N', N'-adenosyl(rRNA) dimethyltransferase [Clostridium acetobutylicum ATCC 824]AAK80927.1 Dimethyladenosine transf